MFSYYRKYLMKKYNLEKALIDADAINCVLIRRFLIYIVLENSKTGKRSHISCLFCYYCYLRLSSFLKGESSVHTRIEA